MNTLEDSVQNRILSFLQSKRRFAVLENFLIASAFGIASAAITAVTLLFLSAVILYLLAPFGFSPTRVGLIFLIALIFVSLFAIVRREQLVAGEFNPPKATFFSEFATEQLTELLGEAATVAILIGPRCGILALRFGAHAVRIASSDLQRFIAPIDFALQHRRKIIADDLPALDFPNFLEEISWIEGVAILHRQPAGFVLTAELRQSILGRVRPFPETETPPANTWIPPEDEELRWALLIMGLSHKPTRKQINAAFRQLAKQIHPDLQTADAGLHDREERMKDLNLAYEILRQHF